MEGHYNPDGSWTSESIWFRSLFPGEVNDFRKYASENAPPPDIIQFELCHPVCREVWDNLFDADNRSPHADHVYIN